MKNAPLENWLTAIAQKSSIRHNNYSFSYPIGAVVKDLKLQPLLLKTHTTPMSLSSSLTWQVFPASSRPSSLLWRLWVRVPWVLMEAAMGWWWRRLTWWQPWSPRLLRSCRRGWWPLGPQKHLHHSVDRKAYHRLLCSARHPTPSHNPGGNGEQFAGLGSTQEMCPKRRILYDQWKRNTIEYFMMTAGAINLPLCRSIRSLGSSGV